MFRTFSIKKIVNHRAPSKYLPTPLVWFGMMGIGRPARTEPKPISPLILYFGACNWFPPKNLIPQFCYPYYSLKVCPSHNWYHVRLSRWSLSHDHISGRSFFISGRSVSISGRSSFPAGQSRYLMGRTWTEFYAQGSLGQSLCPSVSYVVATFLCEGSSDVPWNTCLASKNLAYHLLQFSKAVVL